MLKVSVARGSELFHVARVHQYSLYMGSPVLQFRWPAVPTPGGAAIQLFVAAVVSVAPLSALLLVGIACNLSCLHGTPLLLQVRTVASLHTQLGAKQSCPLVHLQP